MSISQVGGGGEEPVVLKIGGWWGGVAGSIVLEVYFEREEGGRRNHFFSTAYYQGLGGDGMWDAEGHSFLGTYFQEQGETHKKDFQGKEEKNRGLPFFSCRKGRWRGDSVTAF